MSEPTPEAGGPAGRVADKRILVVGSAVAGLLLLGGSLLLLGGDEEQVASEVAFAVPRRAAVAVPSTAAPSPSTPARQGDPVNPFLAGVTDDSGAAPLTDGAAPADPAPGELPTSPPGSTSPVDVLPFFPGLPTSPVEDELPEAVPPGVTAPAPVPPVTVPPTAPVPDPPATVPTSPVAARHTLVLTRVTGTAPDLVGRFLLDGEVRTVTAGDDALSTVGPGIVLLGLEESGTGWTAVVRVGEAPPVNLPAGTVLRFG